MATSSLNLFAESSRQSTQAATSGAQASFVTCTITVNNKSNVDVKQGNVALQDSDTGDTQGAYFGYIRANGGTDSRTVSLRGGWEIVLVNFDAVDGTGWTGSGAGNNSRDLEINLNGPKP